MRWERKFNRPFLFQWYLPYNVTCKSFLIICLGMYENFHEASIYIYLDHQTMGLSISEAEFYRTQLFFSGFWNCVTVSKSGDTPCGLWHLFGFVCVSCGGNQKNSHCKLCIMIHVNARQKQDFHGTQQSFMTPKAFLTRVAPVLEADHHSLRRRMPEWPSGAMRSFSFKGQNFPWTHHFRATTGKKKKRIMRTR